MLHAYGAEHADAFTEATVTHPNTSTTCIQPSTHPQVFS